MTLNFQCTRPQAALTSCVIAKSLTPSSASSVEKAVLEHCVLHPSCWHQLVTAYVMWGNRSVEAMFRCFIQARKGQKHTTIRMCERCPGPLRCCLNSMMRQFSLMKKTRVYVGGKPVYVILRYSCMISLREDFLDERTHVNVGLAVRRP